MSSKKINLCISYETATQILINNLREVTPHSRMMNEQDLHGDVIKKENNTIFNVGLGLVGKTTATGIINSTGIETSSVTYKIKGPFLAFFKKDIIKRRIIRIYRAFIVPVE